MKLNYVKIHKNNGVGYEVSWLEILFIFENVEISNLYFDIFVVKVDAKYTFGDIESDGFKIRPSTPESRTITFKERRNLKSFG